MKPARMRDVELEEPDRITGHDHPRQTYELWGQDTALARAARAIRSARPPQAWLICGPPGIGKASLAYRIARYVLRYGATAQGPLDLSVPPDDPVCRKIEAQSHPGLLTLKRRLNDRGKLKTVLDVEEVRRLGGFYGMTAEAGGWRVAIVDSVDEMNDNSANALLKILEEPPPSGMLLLISHAPGRLLPTIRSRTQRLDLRPLPLPVLDGALARLLPDLKDADRVALAELADGSLGLALRLASEDGLSLARSAQSLLERNNPSDYAAIMNLAEKVAKGTDTLEHFGEFLAQAIGRLIRERAQSGNSNEAAVALWERTNMNFARATGLHLEPRQTILATARDMSAAKGRGVI